MLNFMQDPKIMLNSDYHRACLRGDTAAAVRCLDGGADINTVRSDMPAILVAVHGKHYELALELIKRNVEVNVTNRFGAGPLHFAAEYGHEELVDKLLEAISFVNRRDGVGDTPLHMAVKGKSIPVILKLLARGAEVNMQNDQNDTPMHMAAKDGPIELAEALMKVPGVRLDIENNLGQTPISLAYDPELKAKMESQAISSSVTKALAPSGPDVVDVADMGKAPETPAEEAPKKRRIMKA